MYDIIFGSTKKKLCIAFEKMMHEKLQMSSIGELTFFLGLQVKQKHDGIFISQDKYVAKILKKFGFIKVKTASTPLETQKPLLKDENGKEVNVHMYRSMIGSLMYHTSSRPDIMSVVYGYARYQVNPKCDGVGIYDWSFQAEKEPTSYALMAFTSSSSSSSDNELRDNALVVLRQKFEKAKQERDDLKLTLEKFQTSSKNLSQLLASQTNDKTRLGYNNQVFTSSMFYCDETFISETDESLHASPNYDRYHSRDGYHAIPPPYTGTFMPPKPNLVFHDVPNVSDSDDDSEAELPHNAPSFVQSTEQVKTPRPSVKPVETSIPAANLKTAIPKPKTHGNSRNRKACFVLLTKSKLVLITVARLVTTAALKPHVTKPRPAKTVVTKPYSPPRRNINHSQSPKPSNFPPKVTTVKAPMVNAIKGVQGNWNRVLVTKPQNQTPCELLLGRKPSIGFMRPFGYPVTILNTLDPLGTGPIWLFNIDTLTKSMNYQPVTAGNQSNPSAGVQEQFDAEKVGEENVQQYVLFPLWSSGSKNPQNTDDDAAFGGKKPEFEGEKPESERLSPSSKFDNFFDNNINEVNAANSPIPVVGPTNGKSSFMDPSQYPDDPNMPALEDITYSDDEDDVGAEADFTNLETNITVSPIPTTRVHKDHHVTQIIGDLFSATQTRSMIKVVKDQGGLTQINQEDFHTCMFACFLSQEEPKRKKLCIAFKKMMHEKLQMSSIGELTFFLGLQVKQKQDGIFISQNKYVAKILKKFRFIKVKTASTPLETQKPLLKDEDGKEVNVHMYSELMWVNSVNTELTRLGMVYTSPVEDHVYFAQVGSGIVHPVVANSTIEAEYIAALSCCRQVLWIQNQLHDYSELMRVNSEEPKKVIHAFKDPSWLEAMQEELLQFKLQEVWILVDLPNRKRAIVTKWAFWNKKDERKIVIRNKTRLATQGYTKEEEIDYDKVFVPVARIKAIRLFLAYASFKDFVGYQMDVKSAFLYGKIKKAVGKLNKTLFIKRQKGDILLVQVYMDNIIFGSTKKKLCIAFEMMMHEKLQMSSMGELTFFLGLQVKQKPDGIFISQDKYVAKILKKFRFTKVKTASTPLKTQKPLLKDEDGKEVNVHMYRSMIGSLMYLTSSRPDIMSVVCGYARYQVNPKVSYIHVVKRIFSELMRVNSVNTELTRLGIVYTSPVEDHVYFAQLGSGIVQPGLAYN
nr:hypothetical protein [Tanacetum cinerariifolium]